MPYPAPTTGLGIATRIKLDAKSITLSLSGVNTHQISPVLYDAAGTIQTGPVLALTSASGAVAGATTYADGIVGGAGNAFQGEVFTVAGFTNAVNNGTFVCIASTGTSLTLSNPAGVTETHAATATQEGTNPFIFISRNPAFVSVSPTGLVMAVKRGCGDIEVEYPVFGNTHGKTADGTHVEKIFADMFVSVKS